MSGEDKAREALAACYLNAGGSAEIAEAVRQDDQCLIKDSVAIAAMLAFADMRLDEAVKVARDRARIARLARSDGGNVAAAEAVNIATSIEALKDQK